MKSKLFQLGLLLIVVLMLLPESELLAQGKSKKGPPSWAPAHGYRAQTRHVYFPDYNVYYDLENSVYISYSNGDWQVKASIPISLKGVNLEGSVQVQLEIDTDSPQKLNAEHKVKYKEKNKEKGPKSKPDKGKSKKKN